MITETLPANTTAVSLTGPGRMDLRSCKPQVYRYDHDGVHDHGEFLFVVKVNSNVVTGTIDYSDGICFVFDRRSQQWK